ncbi:MAG: YHS domain-containing (seleno)protein [Aestuariivirga sp.]
MLRRSFLALFTAMPFANAAYAAKPEIFAGLVEGVGAGGFDVVSFFTGTPAEGKAEFSTEWKGATWRFATAENLAAFQSAPEKYAPQYGGYCAYGVAQGYAVKGEPEAWSVVDGKLYLNYSLEVRDQWKADIPGFIATANTKWPKVLE